jgi:hypothetical protein
VKRASFEAKLAVREKADNDGLLNARKGTTEQLCEELKLSEREQRQFVLVPAMGIKVVDEFRQQGFHRRPASLKEK